MLGLAPRSDSQYSKPSSLLKDNSSCLFLCRRLTPPALSVNSPNIHLTDNPGKLVPSFATFLFHQHLQSRCNSQESPGHDLSPTCPALSEEGANRWFQALPPGCLSLTLSEPTWQDKAGAPRLIEFSGTRSHPRALPRERDFGSAFLKPQVFLHHAWLCHILELRILQFT